MKKKWFGNKAKSYSSRITLEQLEERIVLDASVPATSVDNPENPDNAQVEQQAQQTGGPEAQNAPTQAAADAAAANDPLGQIFNNDAAQVIVSSDMATVESLSPQPLRAVVVSSDINDGADLVSAIKDNVVTIAYDAATANSETILSSIEAALAGRTVDSIAFVSHDEGPGAFSLTDNLSVSFSSLASDATLQNFWHAVGQFVKQDGRIDIAACDVASSEDGLELVAQIEALSGRNVAASSDPTGNADFGANWELETDGVSLLDTYLDANAILNFDGRLQTFTVSGVNETGLRSIEGAAIDLDPDNNITLSVAQNYTATLQIQDYDDLGSISSVVSGLTKGSFDSDTGIWTMTGNKTNLQNALRAATFTPDVSNYDLPMHITLTVQENANDELPAPIVNTVVKTIALNSDPATLSIADNSFVFTAFAGDPIAIGADSNIVVNDPDTGDILTARLTWNRLAGDVEWSGGTETDGSLDFTGDKDTVNDLLESVVFVPDAGWGTNTNITVSVKDSDGATFDASQVISLKKNIQTRVETWDTEESDWVAFNQSVPYERVYIEGYQKDFLPTLKILDNDLNEIVSVTLTLDDATTGYLTSKTDYSRDSALRYQETNVDADPELEGVWTYSGTVANANSILGKVVFVPYGDNDVDSSVSVRITDGDSTPVTGTINYVVVARNDQPEFVALPGDDSGVIEYDENTGPVSLAGIEINDPDTGESDLTVSVTLYEPDNGNFGLDGWTSSGIVTNKMVDGLRVWSVTGTEVQVNETLDHLHFIPVSDNDLDSTISVEVTDHADNTVIRKEYLTLDVIPVEGETDPVQAGFYIAGEMKPSTFVPTVSYEEGYENVWLPQIIVTDDDPGDIFTVTFTLTNTDSRVTIAPEDVKDVIGYVETYDDARTLSFEGDGVWKLEDVNLNKLNEALGHLRFQPGYDNDHNANLNIEIVDSGGTSVTADVILKVKGKNDQPVFIDTPDPDAPIVYDEDALAVAIKTGSHYLQVNDIDTAETLTAVVTLSDTSTGKFTSQYTFGGVTKTINSNVYGIWTIKNKTVAEVNEALEHLSFIPKANNEKTSWFSVEVKDGGENSTVTQYREFYLQVTPKNDQVTVSTAPLTVSYGPSMATMTALALPDIKVSDIDANEQVKATFTVNMGPEAASLSRFSATVPDSYAYKVEDGVGTWTYSGTVAQLNAAIKDLKFIPEDEFPAGFAGITSLSVKIEDGLENGTVAKEGVVWIDYGTKTSWWDLLE